MAKKSKKGIKWHHSSIRLRPDQKKFLDENDSINLSGIVRQIIDALMDPNRNSPLIRILNIPTKKGKSPNKEEK